MPPFLEHPTDRAMTVTLTLVYVKGICGKELDAVREFGLDEKQVRFSVALEEERLLMEAARRAMSSRGKGLGSGLDWDGRLLEM